MYTLAHKYMNTQIYKYRKYDTSIKKNMDFYNPKDRTRTVV